MDRKLRQMIIFNDRLDTPSYTAQIYAADCYCEKE